MFEVEFNITGFMDTFLFSLLVCQDVKVRPLVEYDSKSLEGILPEIPLWVKNPDYDRVWFSFDNKLAKTIFILIIHLEPNCLPL
jgi:hypothetical protein